MLVAKILFNNEIVYSYICNRDYLKKLSKDKALVCQECNNPVIFKSGRVKIAHFAHYKCECPNVYWENESADHMRSKVEIKEKLELLYPNSNVYLEYKVEETQQRSDVMIIHPDGERWAFEVQLSRITIAELFERRSLYLKSGVLDFWLMGYEYSSSVSFSTSEGSRVFKLTIDESIFIDDINLNSISIRTKNKSYSIYDVNLIRIAAEAYKKDKVVLYNALRTRYYNSEVTVDSKIDSNETVDILIISKSGTKFAINLLYRYYHDMHPEYSIDDYMLNIKLHCEKAGVNLFWVNGMYKVDKNSYCCYRGYEGYGYESCGYYLEEKEGAYFIKNDYYREYYSEFPIENITISKLDADVSFLLEDTVKVNEFSDYKRDRYIEYKERCPNCNSSLRIKRQFSYPILYCSCGYTKRVETLNCPSCRFEMKFKYSKANFRHYWICKNYPDCNTITDVRIDNRK
ncbi:topoisomerase DNA-binding C4 zinc finger domain-containing protein [Clostridium estertheticum]|uniref:competence protein CoiA n=1 Tax=Clostridium estertheticum TaxID=238834 RepID=UPI0013E9114D|nr:competence protein CoiA family protein [Clostridium estertheticum]MBZ9688489.1 topoisomerase DNA-binding C4 zinc finger domain-containing protein [Clostridium estertheticum]